MAETIQLGIKVKVYGTDAASDIRGLSSGVNVLGDSAKKTATSIEQLSSGWSAFSKQGKTALNSLIDYRQAQLDTMAAARRLTDGMTASAVAAKAMNTSVKDIKTAMDSGSSSLERYVLFLGKVHMIFMATQQIGSSVSSLIDTQADFGRLNASLKTVTGSLGEASAAMGMLRQFAVDTPYTLQQVTEAFIRLQSMGLDATATSLRSYGNTAAAMGKPMMQFIEAVADATTNEFERLKEFGIKAQQDGNQVTLTFRGVTTTIEKSAESIQRYLLSIGNTQFAGGMTDQMKTVGGAMSNMDDAWSRFKLNISSSDGIIRAVNVITTSINALNEMLEKSSRYGNAFQVIPRSAEEAQAWVAMGRTEQAGATHALEPVTQVGQAAISAPASQSALSSLGDIQKMVYQEAIKQKFDPAFALAIAEQESRFKPNARSPVGAQGVMQLMPGTAKQLGVEIGDLADNIKGGVTYLKQQFDSFHSLKLTAAAYNAGPGAVTKYGGVPPYRETQGYVTQVGERYQKYKQMLGDSGGQMFGSAEDLKKEADTYYRIAADTIDRTLKLQDAQSATEKARRLAQVDQIQAAADKAEKASTITIKTALDQTGIEAGMKAIDAAEKKQADYLRQANAAASGNAEVQAAQREIAALDQKIAKAKQYGQDEAGLITQRAVAEENLKQARIKAGQDDLSLQKALADNHAKYDALRKSANEDELKYQESRKAYETQVSQATAEGQKQAIDAAYQRYQMAMDAREVERQQLLVNKTGADYVEQQMKNERDARMDQINLIDAERQATQQKLMIDQQVLQVQAAALQQQLAETTDREKQLRLSSQLAQINAGIAANAGQQQAASYSAAGRIGQIYSDTVAKNDQRNIQQVEEAQLRLNQAMQESVQQAQLAAQHMTEAFGATGTAIGQLVTSVAQFSQQMMQTNRDAAAAIEEMHKKGTYTPEKAWAVQDAAAKKSIQYQIGLFGSLTEAASGFFNHTSKGYKAMQTAAQIFRAIEMGLAVRSAVLQIGQMIETMTMDTTKTQVQVANAEEQTAAKSGAAIAGAAADGGIVGMVAMGVALTTMLAGIGMAIGGAMGGGSVTVPNPEDRQKATGTGTVLGDSTAQSKSMADSLKLLTDNSSADLSYSRDMLSALQNIDRGINGLSTSIYANIKGVQLNNRQLKSGKEVVDFGIMGTEQSVSSIINKGLAGAVYSDVKKTVSGMTGETVKWVKTVTDGIPKTVSQQFGAVLADVVGSLGQAADTLGKDRVALMAQIDKTRVDVGQISLKGLSASQINDQLNAVISSIGDRLAQLITPDFKAFQQSGEGYYATLIRVIEGSQRASGMLDQLGLSAIRLAEVQNKKGDVASEIIRQSVMAQADLGAGAREYVRTLTGSAQDLIDAAKNIRTALADLRTGGFNADFSTATVNAAGGMQNFIASLASFNEHFMPASDRLMGSWRSMEDSFTRLGLKMPTTNAGFVDLVHGIDQSTVAGQKLFGQVISLAGGFADLMDSTSAATEAVTTAQNNLKAAYDAQVQTLQKVIDGVKTAQSTLSSAYTAQKNTLQQAAQAARTYAQSLKDFIASMQGGSNAIGSPVDQYAALKSQFEQTLTAANSGDETAKGKLQQAAQALLDFNKTWAAGTTQQAQDFSRIQTALTALATQSDTAASTATQQLSLLDQTVSKLIDINSSTISVEQAISELQTAQTAASTAQQQLDALTVQVGALIDLKASTDAVATGMKAVQDAINAYLAAVQAKANLPTPQTPPPQPPGVASIDDVNAANNAAAAAAAAAAKEQKYQAERTAAAAKFTKDINWWYRQVNADRNAGASAKKIQQDADNAMNLIQQAYASPYNLLVTQTLGQGTGYVGDDRYVVTARAKGGYTPAGYTLVGEEGPELVRFDRPSQILTARQTQEALSGGAPNAEMLAELKAIHAESRAQVTVLSQALPVVIDRLDGMNDRVDRIERTYKLRGAMA